MRLYICIDGTFAGTQEDAKAKGKGFSLAEVPTDKAGLIDYLNGMVSEARGGTDPSLFAAEPPKPAAAAPQPSRPAAPGPDAGAEAVGDWLYRHASPSEVHDVFMCLAARFGDLAKAVRS